MENEKNIQQIKTQQKAKQSVAVQIATGIALLAIITAGVGLVAEMAGFTPRTAVGPRVDTPGDAPVVFHLSSPSNNVTNQDDSVNLSWGNATATTYDVYLYVTGRSAVKVTSTGSRTYTAQGLLPNTDYTWKVRARNSYGSRWSSETWSFMTAGMDWFHGLDEVTPGEAAGGSAACGGNNFCDDGPEGANILTCPEFNLVWAACNGIGNKCPDNLADKCLQMTICQCGSVNNDEVNVSPGGPECDTLISTFADPCGI